MSNYSYYQLDLKIIRSMLATCPDTDIYKEHIINKSRKLIDKANSTEGKLRKHLKKFLEVDFSEVKEVEELKGILRSYSSILGEKIDLPDDLKSLLEVSKKINERVTKEIESGNEMKATVFMRDEEGRPIISSHMLLGNIKEILRTIINSGDKFCFKSKVQLGESTALDIKVVEEFLVASKDIIRLPDGDRKLNVRTIRFNLLGKETTALQAAEELPVDTQFQATLRVRKGSPLDDIDNLRKIFDMGKNLGLGQWRSSGNKGAYVFKLKALKSFKEDWGDWE